MKNAKLHKKTRPPRGEPSLVNNLLTLVEELSQLDGRASFFQALFHSFSFVFLDFFLYGSWSAIDDSFSFTKTKTSDFFDSLDDGDLLSASVFQDDVEFAFAFIGGSATFSRSSGNCDSCSSWLDAVFVFENIFEFVDTTPISPRA